MSANQEELIKLLANLPKDKRAALEEALRNKDKVAAQSRFDLQKILFDKQLEVVNNLTRKKVIVSSRRAGKSYFIAAYMLFVALNSPRSKVLYLGLTKGAARNVIWDILVNMVEDYQLPCKPNNHTLRIEFNNRSLVYIEGAKDQTSVERIRGNALHLAVLDEAQGFSPLFAKSLVEEILMPALGDYDGELILAGTPDPGCTSILYKAWNGDKGFHGFEKFHWNITHNVRFPRFVSGKATPETYLDEICRETGLTKTDGQFIREYLGKFVSSENERVYAFDAKRDYVDKLPEGHEWQYIISCDPGYVDADGIVVGAYSLTHPVAYIVDCYTKEREDISEFMAKIMELRDKYEGAKVILDPGGGGRKIVEELNNRYKIGAKAAQKYNPKTAGAAIVSSELRQGRLKLLNTLEVQQLAFEWENIVWTKKLKRDGTTELIIPDGSSVVGEGNKIIGDNLADPLLYLIKYLKSFNYQKPEDELTPQEKLSKMISEHKRQLVHSFKEEESRPRSNDWFL